MPRPNERALFCSPSVRIRWPRWPLSARFDCEVEFHAELPIFGISFIGLSNYVELWRDPRFWHSLNNTLLHRVSVTLEAILG
jgi:ABC-type sugar transport system permease subunit